MIQRSIAAAAVSATLVLVPLDAGEQPTVTTIGAVTSFPDRFCDRPVRLTGRYSGRGASTSILQPLRRGRWDFVLRGEDAAVWVTGLRPVGRDFDLDPRAAPDSETNRWLTVTGTVRTRRGKAACGAYGCPQVWIEASDMQMVAPPLGAALQTVMRPAGTPPTIVFHDPLREETDVPRTTAVRFQFSRRMAADTFSERVRASYASLRSVSAGSIPAFSALYHDDTRGLEIRFAAPLDRGQRVKIELLDGIRAADGRKFEPWVLTFTTES
jgi:hypothetical protein